MHIQLRHQAALLLFGKLNKANHKHDTTAGVGRER